MSTQGEAAEQVVSMVTNLTVKGVEVTANLAGRGALSLATFLIAAIKDQKRTKGKVRMRSFEGKPTKVFVIKNKDMPTFAKEAKQYGIKYAAIINKKEENGLCDVVVNAEDAARVSRIAERFSLSSIEVDKMREEIKKTPKQQMEFDEPTPSKANPTKAATASSRPLERGLKSNSNTERDRSSVRKEIQAIKQERKTEKPRKQQQTKHIQPPKKYKYNKKAR